MTVREEVWPAALQYRTALHHLPSAFPEQPALAAGTVHAGKPSWFPWSAAGANAIVFSLTTNNGRRVALRCFTRPPQHDVDERYRALGAFLRSRPCPVFANFDWMDRAIVVDGKLWPVLQMEWIDGLSLKQFVSNQHRAALEELSAMWRRVVADLEARRIAHGDLQHGNVIVSSASQFRFVDLDGVWCDSTAAFRTTEAGLPAYQHPERVNSRAVDYRIDRFSAIVIYVSLRALVHAPRPTDVLSRGDSLILSVDDIKAAKEENARDEAWEFLLRSPAVEVCRLAEGLHAACRGRLEDVPSLDELVSHSSPPPPPPPPPPTPGAQPGVLNTWPPEGAPTTPPQRDATATYGPINVWGEPTPTEQRRTKPKVSPQQWGAPTDVGATPQGAQGATPPPPASVPTPPAGGGVGQILLGVVLLLFAIGAIASETAGGAVLGIVLAVAGVSLITQGAQRNRR